MWVYRHYELVLHVMFCHMCNRPSAKVLCACVYMQVYCTLKNGNGSFTECILGCVNHMFMYSVSAIGQIETDDKWYISQIA